MCELVATGSAVRSRDRGRFGCRAGTWIGDGHLFGGKLVLSMPKRRGGSLLGAAGPCRRLSVGESLLILRVGREVGRQWCGVSPGGVTSGFHLTSTVPPRRQCRARPAMEIRNFRSPARPELLCSDQTSHPRHARLRFGQRLPLRVPLAFPREVRHRQQSRNSVPLVSMAPVSCR